MKGDPERFWQGPATVVAGLGDAAWLSFHRYIIKGFPEFLRYATQEELRSAQMISAESAAPTGTAPRNLV